MKKHQPQVIEASKEEPRFPEIYLFLKRCKAVVGGVTGAPENHHLYAGQLMLEHSMPDTPIFLGGNIGPCLSSKWTGYPKMPGGA